MAASSSVLSKKGGQKRSKGKRRLQKVENPRPKAALRCQGAFKCCEVDSCEAKPRGSAETAEETIGARLLASCEWVCTLCRSANNAARFCCQRCLASSSEGIVAAHPGELALWECETCGTVNPEGSAICRCSTCAASKSSATKLIRSWPCGNCWFPFNLWDFSKCVRCGVPKLEVQPAQRALSSENAARHSTLVYLSKCPSGLSAKKLVKHFESLGPGALKHMVEFLLPAFHGPQGLVEFSSDEVATKALALGGPSVSGTVVRLDPVRCGPAQWLCERCGHPNGTLSSPWCFACGGLRKKGDS